MTNPQNDKSLNSIDIAKMFISIILCSILSIGSWTLLEVNCIGNKVSRIDERTEQLILDARNNLIVDKEQEKELDTQRVAINELRVKHDMKPIIRRD
jgi:hypothetical protein